MFGFWKRKAPDTVALRHPPIGPDNFPKWNDEIENIAIPLLFAEDGRPLREHVTVSFSTETGVVRGFATLFFLDGSHRVWEIRTLIFPVAGDKFAASINFRFPGEKRELPNGGVAMHWRLPVNETFDGLYDSIEAIDSEISSLATQIDDRAEKIYRAAVSGNLEFQDSLLAYINKLRSGDDN